MQHPPPSEAREDAPIRVLHLTSVEVSNYYLNSLADTLHPRRATLSAATLGRPGGFTDALRRRGVEVRAHAVLGCRILYPLAGVQIAAFAARVGAQVIHGHLFEPSLAGALLSVAGGWPLILTRHHSDAVHRLQGRWRRTSYLALERFISRTARHIIAPSQMVQSILTEVEGVPQDKVTLIPYPQDEARFAGLPAREQVRRELGVGDAHVLVSVSRLHPEKGLPVLIRALATLPGDVRLLIVGTGPDLAALEALASDLNVRHRITFLGWRDDALSILSAADIVVHPSLHEALPSAVIEGLALGRPVIASDVSGVRDILGAEEYGRIVPPGDVETLALAVNQTLGDQQGAEARAAVGRQRLLSTMNPGRVADAHMDCYKKALCGLRL